jgi:membrane fusion protein (multidrug efflux system)
MARCQTRFPGGGPARSLLLLGFVVGALCACGKDEKRPTMGGGPGSRDPSAPEGGKKPEPAPAPAAGKPGAQAPAVEVVVAPVVQKDVPVTLEFVGQTAGFQDVEIRARVEGYLKTQDFVEGKTVKVGDLLYTIDPAEFEQRVARAEGEVASSKALHERAAGDVKRYGGLLSSGAVSQREYDTAVAAEKNAQGKLDSATAALEQAKLDLSYTKITSPVAGLAGQTKVNVGNLVGRGQNTLLTTISVIDPIKVRLSIKEPDFLRLARKKVQDMKEGEPPPKRELEMTLADGTVYPHKGEVLSVDRAVDQATGTVGFEVKFPNPDQILRPGAFAKIKAVTETQQGALLVPQRAVSDVQGQQFVAVVSAEKKVELRRVKTGVKLGSDWVIEEGLKPGETVVVEGVQKVRDGTVVTWKEAAPGMDDGAGMDAPPAMDGK